MAVQKPIPAANKRNLRSNRGMVFLVFVMISAAIWVLNNLNEVHSTSINIPLKLTNIPVYSELNNTTPDVLEITLTGKGFDLIGLHWGNQNDPVVIDVGKLTAGGQHTGRHVISTLHLISNQWREDGKLLPVTVEPDSLILDLSPRSSKKVPVRSNVTARSNSPYGIRGGVILKPDSLLLIGPSETLNSIAFVETETLEIKELTTEKFGAVSVRIPAEKEIVIPQNYVWFYVNAEEYTEGSFEIPVTLPVSQKNKLELLPSAVSVSFTAPVNIFHSINESDFQVAGKLPEDENNWPSSLEVFVTRTPLGIRNLKVEPRIIDYYVKGTMP